MKKLILTAAVCGLFAAPAMAQYETREGADRMAGAGDPVYHFADKVVSKMDRDLDGVVSMQEHEAYTAQTFAQVDRNNDNVLSRQELRNFAEQTRPQRRGQQQTMR